MVLQARQLGEAEGQNICEEYQIKVKDTGNKLVKVCYSLNPSSSDQFLEQGLLYIGEDSDVLYIFVDVNGSIIPHWVIDLSDDSYYERYDQIVLELSRIMTEFYVDCSYVTASVVKDEGKVVEIRLNLDDVLYKVEVENDTSDLRMFFDKVFFERGEGVGLGEANSAQVDDVMDVLTDGVASIGVFT